MNFMGPDIESPRMFAEHLDRRVSARLWMFGVPLFRIIFEGWPELTLAE